MSATAEISVRGKWVHVPALTIRGNHLIARGRLIRVAEVHDEEWMQCELVDPYECIGALKASAKLLPADVFTFAQKVTDPKPRYPFKCEWDSVATVRLTTLGAWWDSLPQATRKNSRRAAKRGVTIRCGSLTDDIVAGIVDINNETRVRQGRPFTHYGKSFSEVRKDQSSFLDRSEFICAYRGEELVGYVKLVYCRGFGTILQILAKNSHYEHRPTNALLARAVERCIEKELSYLVYGRYRYGNQRLTSLMDFKARNGFEEVLVPRYYVPITVRGRLAVAAGLHRDLVAIAPPRAISVGRNIRSFWHKHHLNEPV